MRTISLLLATTFIATQATAELRIYTDTPEACQYAVDIDAEEAPYAVVHEGNAMILQPWGIDGLEYYCEWDEEIVFDWSETSLQIRPGYCAEPGEYIYPDVFVIGMSETEPDTAIIWEGQNTSGEGTRFTLCPVE